MRVFLRSNDVQSVEQDLGVFILKPADFFAGGKSFGNVEWIEDGFR